MAIIYLNPETNQVVDHNPDNLSWVAWSVPDEYVPRLMSGERPKSWDLLVLPDRPKFHKMASGSELWTHIKTHTPELAALLYTTIGLPLDFDNTAVMADIKDMMKDIITALGNDYALHSTPSTVVISNPDDPEGLPIPSATMADHLDQILRECWFGWDYNDLRNPQ